MWAAGVGCGLLQDWRLSAPGSLYELILQPRDTDKIQYRVSHYQQWGNIVLVV